MHPRISTLLVLLAFLGACQPRPDYVATPFFSEAGFRTIRAGMNAEAVRAVLGYPASRFGPVTDPTGARGPKITWNYTVPANWQAPLRFHDFSVTFGPDGLVSGTLACEASWEPHDGTRRMIENIQQCRRSIGDLVLTRPDGSTNLLRANDPGVYLILLDRDVSEGARLTPGPGWLMDALPELLQTRTLAGVKHLYRGQAPESYGELVKKLSPETARECYLEAEPEFALTPWDLDSHWLLYQSGILWSVPPDYVGAQAELAANDQKWLVHRLGSAASGKRLNP